MPEMQEQPQQELEKKVEKSCLRRAAAGCLVSLAGLAALGVAGYFILDSYLSNSYSRNSEVKSKLDSAARDIFESDQEDAQDHLVKEYFNSLPDAFWQEMKNYDFLEKKVIGAHKVNPDRKIVYYWIKYQHRETEESQSNFGTFEMVRREGEWKITGE